MAILMFTTFGTMILSISLGIKRNYKVVWEDLKWCWKKVKPYLSWRFLVCYIPVWFIHNGWAYVLAVIGKGVFQKIAIGWLAWLYNPVSAEKVILIPLSLWLEKKLFPKHFEENETELTKGIDKENWLYKIFHKKG